MGLLSTFFDILREIWASFFGPGGAAPELEVDEPAAVPDEAGLVEHLNRADQLPTHDQLGQLEQFGIPIERRVALWREVGLRRTLDYYLTSGGWDAHAAATVAAFFRVSAEQVQAAHDRVPGARRPAFPRLEAPPRPPRRDEGERTQNHVRVCVDLGTSASAVAVADASGKNPQLAQFFSGISGANANTSFTIDSDIAYPKDKFKGKVPTILGREAVALSEKGTTEYDFHRSLKRMLSDLPRRDPSNPDYQPHLVFTERIEAMLVELLMLAFLPEHSGTMQHTRLGDRPEQVYKVLGLPDRAGLVRRIVEGHFELYVCVPNAFGNFEEEVIRTAARDAAKNFLARCLEAAEYQGLEAYLPRVTLVREAEAVAWWVMACDPPALAPDGQPREESWMVFDIGAGSTDSAIVTVIRTARGEAVKLQAHAGATFAGDDLDLLLMREVARKKGVQTAQELDQVLRDLKHSPFSFVRGFAFQKRTWATQVSKELEGQPDAGAWLGRLAEPDGPEGPPLPLSTVFRITTGSAAVWGSDAQLEIGDLEKPYGRFLRGTVVGVLDALRARRPEVKLTRVIISGRGTQAPGVIELVRRRLTGFGWITSPGQVQQVRAMAGDGRDFLKLACVRGIAVAASKADQGAPMTHALSEEITFRTGIGWDSRVPIWPRGRRMNSDTLRAGITLTSDEYFMRQTLQFGQGRCHAEVARAIGDSQHWAAHHIGRLDIDVAENTDIHVVFNCRNWALHVFRRDADGQHPLRIELDPEATYLNPITDLPFDWENRRA